MKQDLVARLPGRPHSALRRGVRWLAGKRADTAFDRRSSYALQSIAKISSLFLCFVFFTTLALAACAAETNSLTWHRATDRVDADVQGEALLPLLGQVASETGWRVYVEPGTAKIVSAKFTDLPSHDALGMLLGNLNFMLSPQTNGPAQLYVFSTVLRNATQRVVAPKPVAHHIANELLVKLKPGANIDALAKLVGAKVVGRDDKMGIYRLQFADAATTDAALGQLQDNSDVQAADYNYVYDQPPAAQLLSGSSLPPVSLQLKPPGDSGKIIVGLVDTAVQPLDGSLQNFLLKQLSVADGTQAGGDTLTHGTAMAETILRSLETAEQGSSSVQILPVDVYGSSASTTSWNVAEGLADAVNNGANVINMSLGGTGDSTFLSSLIQTVVVQDNIPVYAAAGNNGNTTPEYPAADPYAIAVTAVQQQGQLASYADYWPGIPLAAPGNTVAYYGGQPWLIQGTSVSTAYITRLAAGTADITHETWAAVQTALAKAYPVPAK